MPNKNTATDKLAALVVKVLEQGGSQKISTDLLTGLRTEYQRDVAPQIDQARKTQSQTQENWEHIKLG